MTRPVFNAIEPGGGRSPTRLREGRPWARAQRSSPSWHLPRDRTLGLITLGEAAPALRVLRDRMRTRELHSEDLPGAYVPLLYGLPDEAPVVSRVDQLTERNRINNWVST